MRQSALNDTAPDIAVAALQESRAFERLLAEVSAGFIDMPADRIDVAIEAALRLIVALFDIDRSTVIRYWPESGRLDVTHSVAIDGVQPVPGFFSSQEHYPYALSMALAGKPVVYSRLDDLPPEAGADRRTAEMVGLKSHVMMPMFVAGEFQGGLCFGCTRHERARSDEMLYRMRLLASVFSSAMARKGAQEALDQALEFERLATRLLASLVMGAAVEANAIEQGLSRIGQFLGVESVTLWDRLAGPAGFRTINRWMAAVVPPPADSIDAGQIPWIGRQLEDNLVVRLERLSDLPASAAVDRATLQARGLRSLLVVPHLRDGQILGAISVGTVSAERKWPEPLVPGLRLFAEVFANLHTRRLAEQQKHAAEAEAAQLRGQLAHAARVSMMGQLASALAHELSQPLGAILRNTEAAELFLEHDPPDMEELRAILADIRADDQRAGGVIERLRALLKRGSFVPRALSVRELLETVSALTRNEMATRKTQLRIEAPAALPAVLGDPVQLQQVLLNLVLNAIDAVETQPEERRSVVVCAQPHAEGTVEMMVSDTGPGIAPDKLARIFEPFFTTKTGGMGIGLSISRTIVEAHDGRLWAESDPPQGATFRFTLPLAKGTASP